MMSATLNFVKQTASEKLEVIGLENLVARMRSRAIIIDCLLGEQKIDREKLIAKTSKERLDAEKSGEFHKSCLVLSEDEKPARVTYSNRFKKIDIEYESILKQALGKLFDQLFVVTNELSLRDDVSYEKAKQILGSNLDLLFDVNSRIEACDEFMEKRAQIRSSLNGKINDIIDGITKQVQAEPSVSLK